MTEKLILSVDTQTGQTGDITILLRPDLAPKHVEQITSLARDGFYDGLTFHRVIDGFMAQGGCPDGTGMGGAKKQIPAEFNKHPHLRGVCSMARSSNPNSASSQFFICLDDSQFLDGQYTVWGEVEDGMDLVDALPKGEPPRYPGKIVKASVVEG
ncbi:MAG: peptidylprolyl isomerase [Litorimonas sp.]